MSTPARVAGVKLQAPRPPLSYIAGSDIERSRLELQIPRGAEVLERFDRGAPGVLGSSGPAECVTYCVI